MRPCLVSFLLAAPLAATALGVTGPARADSAAARPDRTVELEARLSFGGMSSYGSGIVIGIPLGERLTLATGVGLLVADLEYGDSEMSLVAVDVPLELKVYLLRPVAGALVPTLRASAAFGYRWTGPGLPDPERQLAVGGRAGLTYLVSDTFGVLAEGGVEYQRSWMDQGSGWTLAISWRVGALFRL